MAFIKFIDKEAVNKFLSGKMRFGSVTGYRDIENNFVIEREDTEEGRYFTQKYVTPYGMSVNFRLESNLDNQYALCLYHLTDKVDLESLKKMKKFGEYAIIIKNEQEFLRRLDNGASREQYVSLKRDVLYYNESIEDEMAVMQLLSSGLENLCFVKRENPFSYQYEYRYLLINKFLIDKPFLEYSIGDISDISDIRFASELISNLGILFDLLNI